MLQVPQREESARLALEDLLRFFVEGGEVSSPSPRPALSVSTMRDRAQVAIFDGTNTTMARRTKVAEAVEQWKARALPGSRGRVRRACAGRAQEETQMRADLMWIESICNDPTIIDGNIRDAKLTSPDYKGTTASTGASTASITRARKLIPT